MSGKAKETASNTMEAIRDKMVNLKNAKSQLPIWRRVFRTASPNSTRFSRPEITRSSKSARRSRTPSTTRRRSWRQRPWVWRMPRSSSWSMRRRSQLSSVDSPFSTTISPVPMAVSRSKVPSWPRLLLQQKLWRFTKTLEGKSFVNDERMDTLEEQIETAREVALRSSRNAEEVARKLAMTQVDHDRTLEKCKEAEVKVDELEKELNVVGVNMKTLELSETNALKRHEDAEEKIRDLILNLKFTEIQAAAAEREAAKLQQELDLLVTDLNEWKEKYGEICVELEQTFNEMAGY